MLPVLAACARGTAPNATPAPPGLPPEMAALVPAERRAAAEVARWRARNAPRPLTRAERTGYTETSRYDDVVVFLDSIAHLGVEAVRVEYLGTTTEGRRIPVVTATRPRDPSTGVPTRPGAVPRDQRPTVYVQANIHAGEVEGKEALQMLLRDLVLDPRANVLDSLVLVAVPIYNADGNERVRPQAVNRGDQNGPPLVGQRPNAQGLDLNRDYIKAEAPETRAALARLGQGSPTVFVDLHTTNGSYHGYALTYSPSLHPSAARAAFAHDTLLPRVAERVRARWGLPTYPYGNFATEYGADVNADTTRQGWYTYDHRPRFGTNYFGLRGGLGVLSEAYSHDPFERRVRATYAFVRELLSEVAAAPRPPRRVGIRPRGDPDGSPPAPPNVDTTPVALRARLTTRPRRDRVLAEQLARLPDSTARDAEPGVARGYRRTGRYRAVDMPVHDRFEPTRTARVPAGGWAFDATAPGADAAALLLGRHGVQATRLVAPQDVDAQVYRTDSVVTAARPFQGHREVRLAGAWRAERRTLPAGSYVITPDQPLARLALVLLDPESDDGLVTWNVWDPALRTGGDFPVVRLQQQVAPR